jgi:hypothetical protein
MFSRLPTAWSVIFPVLAESYNLVIGIGFFSSDLGTQRSKIYESHLQTNFRE